MNLPKTYEPKEYEDEIYKFWEENSAFKPVNRGSEKNFSIVVPPPNANGDLHLGHGLTLAIEDIAIRYHRMKGEAALLLPGADHAGFETQVVYEKKLAEQGKSRFDFSREELYEQIWEFVAKNRGNYESQFRKLGASVDWTRFTFTLDEKVVKQTHATFKKMWEEGLIYRGERLVNFCTFHGTSFADIEVSYQEIEGHLWHIKYPLTDGSGEITVATTRPETMLGDTAVAVQPDDKRYKKFIGKTVKLPLTKREIPIIADSMVDRQFGSGAVKITPAHDPNDYEVALRHDLPMISVIDHEGKISHEAPEAYRQLKVDEARVKVVEDLKSQGFLVKTEPHVHSVGHCYKCSTVIQPLLKEQWFIEMKTLSKKAIEALSEGKITFYPKNKKDQLIKYLESLRDWNISRQIAWGIPIPAFVNIEDPADWIYDERVGEEIIEVNGKKYTPDPDVFDTWFSSSSWPYVTLNYPNGEDYKKFYPTSLMETGADILYPWVSRMIMFGLYNTREVPFETVYLHGLIQDEEGQKMSKSKGNVIAPMDIIEQYGSDAFRMGIVTGESAGSNRPFDRSKVVGSRNFCNKLWNVARFIEDKVGDHPKKVTPDPKTIADDWMLIKLQQSIGVISAHLDNFRFSEASEHIYHLVWDDLADWYIEASKTEPNPSVLIYALETVLKLAHPFVPFVTETIWQTLKWHDNLLITSPWPEALELESKDSSLFEAVKKVVSEIRSINSALNRTKPKLIYSSNDFISEQSKLIVSLASLDSAQKVEKPRGLRLIATEAWLDFDDQTVTRYLDQLASQLNQQEKLAEQLEKRLEDKKYVANAPAHIVEETKKQLLEAKAQLETQRSVYEQLTK